MLHGAPLRLGLEHMVIALRIVIRPCLSDPRISVNDLDEQCYKI